MGKADLMDKLVSLAKRRGYVFQSSEIYGGTGSVWDYGALGVELKRNVKERWWSSMVHRRDDIEGIDAAILMHPKVWEASGHVEGFTDPLVECRVCHRRFRADRPEVASGQCPTCGTREAFGEARMFNLMFRTFMGPVEDAAHTVYLRPETAQGIYTNFLNTQTATRQKVPFGIAQIGKAFRNEITPGNFIFRTREFEQAEMQFFVKPGTDEEWFERWREERMEWHVSLGIRGERLRYHEHGPDELAHYAKKACDVEYEFPFGWKEFEGIHNRTDFDLGRHEEYSGKRLAYIDSAAGERFIPYVVETSMGVDRLVLVLLADAYEEEMVEGKTRVVLKLDPSLAPLKVAVFPLMKKHGLPEIATKLRAGLGAAAIPSFYDQAGSIGRRYRRQDEAGTPWCVTVDGRTAEDGTVTVRERDSLEQIRVSAERVVEWVKDRLALVQGMLPVLLLLFLWAPALAAQKTGGEPPPQSFDWSLAEPIPAMAAWGQRLDTLSTRLIRMWTTMPEYTNALVDHLPEHPTVVSPTRHFGHPVGKPGVLHGVDEIHGYFEALSSSSPRVHFDYLGETEEGRRLALVKVGSERNLARLEEIKEGTRAIADPRRTSEEEAARLIRDIPPVYTFMAGLHSSETGPPEMVMELAYRLAVSDDPMIRTIRDNVVVFIIPVAEPDGRDRIVDWYRLHNADDIDGSDRVPGPPYWGKYIYHDNNRDGLQLSARLTQEVVKLFLEWKYPVGHDLHESIPYLYISTGTGPYNPAIDPIAIGEWQWMSNYEVAQLTALGLPGVWTHNFYSGWYPGYLLWVTNTRNAVGRFYETQGVGPHTREVTLGERSTSVEWYRPNPPRDTTYWSLRNNTNYMQSGALNALLLVAENRTKVMGNYWRKANNSLKKGRREAPYAYVVPAGQSRKADAGYMLTLLQRQGVEVHRATAGGDFGDVSVTDGDYVIRMDQPYRNLVLTLMEKQDFPADAPSPYDDVAWTYPLMFNVEASPVDTVAIQRLAMEEVPRGIHIPGSLTERGGGEGSGYVVAPEASAHSMRARLALGSTPVRVAEEEIVLREASGEEEGESIAPGAWLIAGQDADEARIQGWAEEEGMEVMRIPDSHLDGVSTHEMDLPRIAILHSWTSTQAEGWTRFTFDQAGVPYRYVADNALAALGRLRDHFDVIVFPPQGGSAKSILQGMDPKYSPLPYRRSDAYPSLGTPDSTDDMTGGLGLEGLMALRDFVREGGTFVALGSTSRLPLEFGFLREANVRDAGSIFIPGSILKGRVTNPRSPVTYGYGESLPLYHQRGPYLSISAFGPDSARINARAPVRYASGEELLLSGVAKNAGPLGNQPVLYHGPLGEGQVVVFGFDTLHRHQNHMNHALVWNVLMNWNDLAVAEEVAEMGDKETER